MSGDSLLSQFRKNLFKALEARTLLFPDMDSLDLVRLCHEEAPPLRWDKLGQVHWLGWWSDQPPSKGELNVIEEALTEWGAESWALEWRKNREKSKNPELLLEHAVPARWTATERGQWYLIKSDQGQSRGVFLDQREQRSWVKMNSAGKMVLNLFAYTCGFSVAAALGGANSVHSVDLSKSYLAWGRENFKLNHVPQESHKFYARDCMEFLKHAERNNLHYDLIICDPPSFGRSGKRVFQIAKDLPELLRRVVSRLTPGGELLFSTNYEGWSSSQLQKILEGLALPISIDASAVQAGEDFRSTKPILKGALIRRSMGS